MSIIITLIALSVVVFIHELGHFLAARYAGIGVLEFAVGMGPKVISKKIGGTLYSFRLFPLGGFVSLAGMDGNKGEAAAQERFQDKSISKRFLTLFSGSAMNIILGFFIFVGMFSLMGVDEPTSRIEKVFQGTPAAYAGLIPGDVIQAINQHEVRSIQEDVLALVQASSGEILIFTIQRDQKILNIAIKPTVLNLGNEKASVGVQFSVEKVRYNPVLSIGKAFEKTWFSIKHVFFSLKLLVTGNANFKDMAGPLGIIQFASFQLDQGVSHFFNLMALISISLGVINLFPFPVLDGGHLVFLGFEFIVGKPLNQKVELYIGYAGTVVLVSLMGFVLFNDIINWNYRVNYLKELLGS